MVETLVNPSVKFQKGQMRPKTARQLWNELVRLFPDFALDHTEADLEEAEREGTPSLHSVMIPFTQYFGGAQHALSKSQLVQLGALLSEAVEIDDDWENAVSTCFLEHLRHIRAYKTLAPYLSKRAKTRD